jgi:hypothetical protein
MGCAVLFEKANTMLIELLTAVVLLARNSVFRLELLATPRCSWGLAGAGCSAGSAEVKFHSSSSLDAAAAAGCGAGGETVEKAEAKALEAV